MPATGLKRSMVIRRVLDLIEITPGFEDCQVSYAPPHITWQYEATKYIEVTRVTGEIQNPRFGIPNPTFDDHANVEVWTQGFGEDSEIAAERAEEAMTLVLTSISPNRQLALNDSRLEGVQTSWFTELDGPMFLGTDEGVIVSYRTLLHVHSLVRIET